VSQGLGPLRGEGWERGHESASSDASDAKIHHGGGKKGIKNGQQSGFGNCGAKGWSSRRHQDTLGLQGPADSGKGMGEVVFSKGPGFV